MKEYESAVVLADRPLTFSEVEKLAAALRRSRDELQERLQAMQDELQAVKRRHLVGIKSRAVTAASAEAELQRGIELSPHLFKKPKMLILHGIKVGYRASAGRITFDDAEVVCKLIKRHFADRQELLIREKLEPRKEGLKTLTVTELSKIGCRVEGAGDQVVLDSADSEIEKLLEKLVAEMVEAATHQE